MGDGIQKTQLIIVGLAVLSGLGILAFHRQFYGTKPTVEILGSTQSSPPARATPSGEIAIDVGGAVHSPGVVRLTPGARVADAIAAAGGLSSEADQDRIGKEVNLAAALSDGWKLYIPKVGDRTPTNASIQSGLSPLPPAGAGPNRVVNINAAGQKDLEEFPGIGPVTARKIIDGRPHQHVSDLLTKKIVSQRVYDAIKDQISVY